MMSDDDNVCLSRTSGLSREQRPSKNTKIGTEVAHVARDSDTTFKVKGQLGGDGGILWRPPAQLMSFSFHLVVSLLFCCSLAK